MPFVGRSGGNGYSAPPRTTPVATTATKIQMATPYSEVTSAAGTVTRHAAAAEFVTGSLNPSLQSYGKNLPPEQVDRLYDNVLAVTSLYSSMKNAYLSGNVSMFDGYSASASEVLSKLITIDDYGQHNFVVGDQLLPVNILQGYDQENQTHSVKKLDEEKEISAEIKKSQPVHAELDWLKREFSGNVDFSNADKIITDFYGGKALVEGAWNALSTGTTEVGATLLEGETISTAITSQVGRVIGVEGAEVVAAEIGAESLITAGAAAVGVDAAAIVGGVAASGGLLIGAVLVAAAGYGLYKALGGTRELSIPDFGAAASWVGNLFSP